MDSGFPSRERSSPLVQTETVAKCLSKLDFANPVPKRFAIAGIHISANTTCVYGVEYNSAQATRDVKTTSLCNTGPHPVIGYSEGFRNVFSSLAQRTSEGRDFSSVARRASEGRDFSFVARRASEGAVKEQFLLAHASGHQKQRNFKACASGECAFSQSAVLHPGQGPAEDGSPPLHFSPFQ